MRNNADNHNASRPNLAGKHPDRPQFSPLCSSEHPKSAGVRHGIPLANRDRLAEN
ncbi:MAG: hypothetical protein JNN08_29780 [Bryobacterales bacterium]|nr:hypothetical protein [Bryobacterales bacterium]